jgi:hypothetical protein
MTTTISLILSLLQMFAGSNPTVEEVEVVLPLLITALANEKNGQAFSLPGIPLVLAGVKGAISIGWSPTAAAPTPPVATAVPASMGYVAPPAEDPATHGASVEPAA